MDDRRIKKRKAKRKKIKVNRLRLVFTTVAIVLIIVFGISLKTIISLHMENSQLKETNKQLAKEKSKLELELKSVDDESYIEEKAREELNLIRPGEVLFMLDKDKNSKNNSDASEESEEESDSDEEKDNED